MLLEDDPGRNIPEYARILSDFLTKGCQVPSLVTSKDHQGADASKSVDCMRAPLGIESPETDWVQHVIVGVIQAWKIISCLVRAPANPFY